MDACVAAPRVSVVVPVYNAERWLGQRLDSLLGQTLRELEVICVDDGSSDASPRILADAAARDSRVRVVHQRNAGPAAARNRGLELARGTYVTAMDADDYCDRELLAGVMSAIDASRRLVDVAVFPERSHNEATGADVDLGYAFQSWRFPREAFTWESDPDHIFTSFQNWLHNKLFRTAFVRENDLRLQDLHHTEDLLFTCSALVLAQGILCVPGPSAVYRIGVPGTQLHATQRYPLDFYTACVGLHDFLQARGIMGRLRRGYVSWVADCVCSNVDLMGDPVGMRRIYETLHDGGLAELGLDDASPDDYLAEEPFADHRRRIERIARGGFDAFVVGENRDNFERWHEEHERLLAVENSRSFRLGRAITSLPRRLRDALSG